MPVRQRRRILTCEIILPRCDHLLPWRRVRPLLLIAGGAGRANGAPPHAIKLTAQNSFFEGALMSIGVPGGAGDSALALDSADQLAQLPGVFWVGRLITFRIGQRG